MRAYCYMLERYGGLQATNKQLNMPPPLTVTVAAKELLESENSKRNHFKSNFITAIRESPACAMEPECVSQ